MSKSTDTRSKLPRKTVEPPELDEEDERILDDIWSDEATGSETAGNNSDGWQPLEPE